MEQKQHYYRKQQNKKDLSLHLPPRRDTDLRQFYRLVCAKMNLKVNPDLLDNIDSDKERLQIHLKELKINEISGVCRLIRHGALRQVILRGAYLAVSPQGTTLLRSKLQHQIEQQVVNQILDDLASHSTLQVVVIKNVELTLKQVRCLSGILANNQTLQQLGLVNTRLSPPLLQTLAEGLSANSSITSLDLSKNQLGDKESQAVLSHLLGAEEFFEEEDVKKNFRRHFERNKILSWQQGDDSYNQVVVGQGVYSGIISFDLSNNLLGDEFVSQIAPALAHDKCIKSINLRHNQISSDGYARILQVLRTNFTLVSLDLRKNLTQEQDHRILKQILDSLLRNVKINKEQKEPALEDKQDDFRLQELVEKFCEDKVERQVEKIEKGDKGEKSTVLDPARLNSAAQNNTMRNLYESIPQRHTKHDDDDSECPNCQTLKKQLLQAETKYFTLKLENRKIKNFIQQHNLNYNNSQSQMMTSLSMINPVNLIEPERQNMSHITENEHSLSANIRHQQAQPSHANRSNADELLNKIETFMLELTRMMDHLESLSSKTDNFSCSMTDSESANNNLTHKLINSEKQVNLQSLMQQDLHHTHLSQHNTVINHNTSVNTQNNTFNLVLPPKRVSFIDHPLRPTVIDSANTSKEIGSLIGNLLSEKKHHNSSDSLKPP